MQLHSRSKGFMKPARSCLDRLCRCACRALGTTGSTDKQNCTGKHACRLLRELSSSIELREGWPKRSLTSRVAELGPMHRARGRLHQSQIALSQANAGWEAG